jgi:hypothetical protein
MAEEADSFLSRWSRRKTGARAGAALPAEPVPLEAPVLVVPQAASTDTPAEPQAADEATPPPTMADVALLTRDADYTRYLAGNVSAEVKNAALKHLFTDPHFNVMDGLDTYIGDYNTPDPLPAGMLRQMVQSKMLGLFDDEIEADPKPAAGTASAGAAAAAPPPPADPTCLTADENPDLQLQPDDGAGRAGAEAGAGPHTGRPD